MQHGNNTPTLLDIPTEVLYYFLIKYLPPSAIFALVRTCKHFLKELLTDPRDIWEVQHKLGLDACVAHHFFGGAATVLKWSNRFRLPLPLPSFKQALYAMLRTPSVSVRVGLRFLNYARKAPGWDALTSAHSLPTLMVHAINSDQSWALATFTPMALSSLSSLSSSNLCRVLREIGSQDKPDALRILLAHASASPSALGPNCWTAAVLSIPDLYKGLSQTRDIIHYTHHLLCFKPISMWTRKDKRTLVDAAFASGKVVVIDYVARILGGTSALVALMRKGATANAAIRSHSVPAVNYARTLAHSKFSSVTTLPTAISTLAGDLEPAIEAAGITILRTVLSHDSGRISYDRVGRALAKVIMQSPMGSDSLAVRTVLHSHRIDPGQMDQVFLALTKFGAFVPHFEKIVSLGMSMTSPARVLDAIMGTRKDDIGSSVALQTLVGPGGPVSLSWRSTCGFSLVHLAARAQRPDMIQLLVRDFGLDPSDVNTVTGTTPAHVVVDYGHGFATLNGRAEQTLVHLAGCPGFDATLVDGKGHNVVQSLLSRMSLVGPSRLASFVNILTAMSPTLDLNARIEKYNSATLSHPVPLVLWIIKRIATRPRDVNHSDWERVTHLVDDRAHSSTMTSDDMAQAGGGGAHAIAILMAHAATRSVSTPTASCSTFTAKVLARQDVQACVAAPDSALLGECISVCLRLSARNPLMGQKMMALMVESFGKDVLDGFRGDGWKTLLIEVVWAADAPMLSWMKEKHGFVLPPTLVRIAVQKWCALVRLGRSETKVHAVLDYLLSQPEPASSNRIIGVLVTISSFGLRKEDRPLEVDDAVRFLVAHPELLAYRAGRMPSSFKILRLQPLRLRDVLPIVLHPDLSEIISWNSKYCGSGWRSVSTPAQILVRRILPEDADTAEVHLANIRTLLSSPVVDLSQQVSFDGMNLFHIATISKPSPAVLDVLLECMGPEDEWQLHAPWDLSAFPSISKALGGVSAVTPIQAASLVSGDVGSRLQGSIDRAVSTTTD